MKISKILIHIIVFIIMLIPVISLCNYDDVPFKDNKIFFSCENVFSNYSCYNYITELNGTTIQLNPTVEYMDRVGLVNDMFYTDDYVVNMFYTGSNLFSGNNYTVNVICSDEGIIYSENFTISPILRDFDELNYRGLWIAENSNKIVMLFIAFVFVFIFIIIIWKVWRR